MNDIWALSRFEEGFGKHFMEANQPSPWKTSAQDTMSRDLPWKEAIKEQIDSRKRYCCFSSRFINERPLFFTLRSEKIAAFYTKIDAKRRMY